MTFFRYLILLLLPLIFFSWIIYKDINPAGSLEIVYDWQKDQPEVSRLFPADRLLDASGTGQTVINEPVYFTVRLPQTYETVRATVLYENLGDQEVKLGLQQGGGDDWLYDLQTLTSGKPIEFNLKGATVSNRSIRFMITAPGLASPDKILLLKKIEIKLQKPVLHNFGEVWNLLVTKLPNVL